MLNLTKTGCFINSVVADAIQLSEMQNVHFQLLGRKSYHATCVNTLRPIQVLLLLIQLRYHGQWTLSATATVAEKINSHFINLPSSKNDVNYWDVHFADYILTLASFNFQPISCKNISDALETMASSASAGINDFTIKELRLSALEI